MELLISIQWALWGASILAEALLVVRLFSERLLRRYPIFTFFLAAEAICSLILMQTDVRSRSYAEAFRTCTLIMSVFRLGAAGELYERICEHFPGIGRFRVGLAAALVLLAVLFALFTFWPHFADQWAFPQTIVLVQRFESEILATTLALTWIFLRFVLSIRQPFRPNVVTHWKIATVYFGVSGAAHLAASIMGGGKHVVYPINCAMLAAQFVCFVAWFRLMRRSGEELPAYQRLSTDQVEAVERYNRALLETVTSMPGEISARQAENRDIPLHRARPR